MERYEQVIDDYSVIIDDLDPSYVEAYHGRANAHYELYQCYPALRDYAAAIRLDPDNAAFFYGRGLALRCLNKTRPAITDFRRALARDPQYAEAYWALGSLYAELGRYGAAMNQYAHYLALVDDPDEDVIRQFMRMPLYLLGLEPEDDWG
jgi:tetratricopeptide (TPR) repeat protein